MSEEADLQRAGMMVRMQSTKKIRGFAEYLLHEQHPSDGARGFTDLYIYVVPDDQVGEMKSKGAAEI